MHSAPTTIMGNHDENARIDDWSVGDPAETEENSPVRAALEHLPEGILVVDQAGVCVYANSGACHLLGLPRNRIIGTEISQFHGHNQVAHCALQEFLRTGDSVLPVIFHSTRLENLQIEVTAKPDIMSGRHLIVLRDVTEKKNLEEQVRRSQRMESIGRLAGGVAHDFNNMLTVIRGFSELILAATRPDDPIRRYAEGVVKAADRSATITQQLLAFSRRQVMKPCIVNLNAIVTEMSSLLQRLIGEDVELITALAPELGLVSADPAQIGQILLNLSVNARDAMPQGGRLSIGTTNIETDADYCSKHVTTVPGSYVMLSVTDNGCGFGSELQAHIFEPFFTTKDPGKGTGLGLATVYGIVKQSGGHIWVYSEKGEGTTFKIYLPRVTAQGERVILSDRPQFAPGQGETILVIEDDAGAREMIGEALRRNGYHALLATGGDEALRVCEEARQEIDLVITDVVMPGTSGLDLSGYLAKCLPNVRIVYISGFPAQELESRGIAIAADQLLQKPFNTSDLLLKIRENLPG